MNVPERESSSPEEKQKALLERARKGILKFINDKGGKSSLAEMHDYSMARFLIQHQSFSRLMETLVDEKLVTFDFAANEATLTDAGRAYMAQ